MFLYTSGILTSSGDVSVLPGDFGSGAFVAYSLRKVVSTYTGPVARIRRSSDNATIDCTAEQITDGTLLSFVGAGNGFVNILYNQTASTFRNLSQSNAANQPIIVESGVMYTENSKPAMKFDGTKFLSHPTASNWIFLHTEPHSVFSVQRVTGSNPDTLYAIWATGQSVTQRIANFRYEDRSSLGYNNDWGHLVGSSGIVVNNLPTISSGQFETDKLLTARVHGSPNNPTLSLRSFVGVNSNALVNNNTASSFPSASNPTHGLRLGEAAGGWRLVGAISEVIIYYNGISNMVASDSVIDNEMKTYYSIT